MSVVAWLAAVAWLVVSPAHAQGMGSLVWLDGSGPRGANDHLALAVMVKVAGRSCLMQLDTGFNDAVRWQETESPHESLVMVNVELVGLSIDVGTAPEVARHLRDCTSEGSIGTLGNAFFEGGSITVDLKEMALRYQAGSTLAGDPAAQRMRCARWTPQGGHPLVKISQDGKPLGFALLDTGSASVGFAPLSPSQWRQVTSSAPLARTRRVRTFRASSWGQQHACFETALTARLQAGRWALGNSPVVYCPALGFSPPQRLAGVIGLGAFPDSAITIDYPSERWLVRPAR